VGNFLSDDTEYTKRLTAEERAHRVELAKQFSVTVNCFYGYLTMWPASLMKVDTAVVRDIFLKYL
jgi:hypothetical protein